MLTRRPRLTPAGEGFLKCAFAPCDFASDGGSGVPDEYQGKVLLRRQELVTSFATSVGFDTYIIQAPTPGTPLWIATYAAGIQPTTAAPLMFTPLSIPDFNQFFPPQQENVTVESYRFVANAVEVMNTTSYMNANGSIVCYKVDLQQSTQNAPAAAARANQASLSGTYAITPNVVNVGDVYVKPAIEGAYMCAVSDQADFEFKPLLQNSQDALNAGSPTIALPVAFTTHWVGIGNMMTNVVFIPNSGSINTYTARAWGCVEYQVVPSSILYEYARLSPPHDPVAMAMYRTISRNLPIAVPFRENAGFWDNVLRIMQSAGSAVSSWFGGPIGLAGQGVSLLGKAGLSLFYGE